MQGFCRNISLTVCLLAGAGLWAQAQQPVMVTRDFRGYHFDAFVKEIQSLSGYHFYFDPAETDSLQLNVDAQNISVEKLLDTVCASLGLHYAIDQEHRVFISRQFQIITYLPGEPARQQKKEIPAGEEQNAGEEQARKQLKGQSENRIFEIGVRGPGGNQGRATLGGYIRESKSGEAIAGASIMVDSLTIGVSSDQYGYYSIVLSKGRHVLRISSAGMKDTRRQIVLNSDGKMNVEMQEEIVSLKAVTVSAEKTSNIRSQQMGVSKLSIRTIKQVPVVFGEADVLRVVLTLPGVTSAGEAANGFNVRGGSTDQNLILFNDATIYNPSHLFGFFSAFDPDVIKGIELYKGSIPEKYGGRLSSVLDITGQDGNNKKWTGVAGIGPLTSKLTLEGPIQKDKTSIIVGARTTYSNWILGLLPNTAYQNSKAGFYDVSLHLTHIMNAKNTLYLTGYISNDNFNLSNDTTYRYGNMNANIKWKHLFTNKLYNTITLGTDHYQYSVSSSENPVNAFKLGFKIDQQTFRSDFSYSPGNNHVIDFGLNAVYYKLHPGTFEPVGGQSLVARDVVPPEQGLESALYLGDTYTINSNLVLSAGIRYSMFNYLGPHDVYNYQPGVPKDTTTIIDTSVYSSNKIIKTYHAPEVRISLRYILNEQSSIKASFNTTQQYIHMLSNTVTISPTDIWKLSDPHIQPQQGAQFSLGYYRNFKSNAIEASVEAYYKTIRHYMDYKSGASLLLNSHIETDVINTNGMAYGIEFLLKKNSGRLNGWLSYTYSRTFLKQDDPLAGQTINEGNYYPASFDKPNNVNLIGNYRFSLRYSLSLNVVYSTGRPITLPIAVFYRGSTIGLLYSDRNQYRIPDYFRTDLSFTIEGNHKVKQKTHNSWSFGVYNLTARQNAYSVYYVVENGKVQGYQLSIFGTAIPFVTFNLKF
ncbi:MAG TPA: carboxypeptidase-like regulatory domain-containing protein [Puia sp.]|nr:carboxypeptidase-like regulatory domain-containing protein [Puia sp.]